MTKQIQIPEDLFYDLILYHLHGMSEYGERVQKGLEEKYEAWYRRRLYTQSKTAETEEEREQARQQYLDEKGILPDWRW